MYISIRNDKSKVIHLCLIYAWEMLPREILILISQVIKKKPRVPSSGNK